MDFGAFSPEINSARIYTGPGSGPMMAAAAAWDKMAAELSSAEAAYQGVINGLVSEGWMGPASNAMAAAATPYAVWMGTTAAQVEQAAMQAKAAAAAFDAAYAMTVPPPLIVANRSQLAALVATNFLGQNAAAIAATEAQYGQMWAQDAVAMYAYAGSSAAAAMLAPMAVAPPTTNPAGAAAGAAAAGAANMQGAATQAAMGLPSSLNSSASSLVGGFPSAISGFTSLLGTPFGQGGGAGASGLSGMTTSGAGLSTAVRAPAVVRPAMPAMEHLAPFRPAMTAPEMLAPARLMPSAAMGQAAPVGRLSVPASWPAAAPEAAVPAAAPLAGAGAPMVAPRGIPAGQVGGMEMRGFGAAVPARVSVLPQLVG